MERAEQRAAVLVGSRGHEHDRVSTRPQPLDEFVQEAVRLLGRGGRLHHLAGECLRVPLQGGAVEPPEQLGLFIDGQGPAAIVGYDGAPESVAYLDFMTEAGERRAVVAGQ